MALEDGKKTRVLVGNLEEVEPPPGFAQKIMAQVREEDRKKGGLLKKLFYPLHIKVPIQAVATVVIAALAIQVYRSVEPQKVATQPPGLSAPAVSAPAAPKEEPRQESKQEIPPSPAKGISSAEEGTGGIKERRSKDKGPEPAPAPLKKQFQEDRISIAPSQVPKETATREDEKKEGFFAPKRTQIEPEAAAPSPALGAASPRKAGSVNLRMKARDVAASGRAVVTILEDLGAGKIERAPGEGMEVITANLQTKRLKELLEKLGSVGEPEEGTIPSKVSEETVALQIEILKR
jgi:hypothetical protein